MKGDGMGVVPEPSKDDASSAALDTAATRTAATHMPAANAPATDTGAPATQQAVQHAARQNRKATILDVAAAAGISYGTVSRYLNGNPHVSAKSAARIAEAIKRVNYTPNSVARSLVRQRTQMVGFVVHGNSDSIISDPNISTMLIAANRTLGDAGYQLVILLADSAEANERISKIASSGFADGWILNSFHRNDPLFATFQNLDVPIAISGVGYGSLSPFPTVDIDNRTASRELTEYMRGCGHRRIAYICGPDYQPCSAERLKGFREAMGDDFDPSIIVTADDWGRRSGKEAIVGLLAGLAGGDAIDDVRDLLAGSRIDALICGNDSIAAGAMQYLAANGVRIPQDLAVAGFDDNTDALSMHPQLTTVHQPIERFGSKLAEMVLEQIGGGTVDHTVWLPTSIVIRQSTGASGQTAEQ